MPTSQEEILDLLSHKSWKARFSAYEALIEVFQKTTSDTDPAFKPYIGNHDLLKKIATDANAVAQEKGIECLMSLVKYSGETSARTREAVVPVLVDRCFGSSRARTRFNALELTLQYVEVENNVTGVVNDILAGLSAKQPKTVVGCLFALKEIFRIFSVQVVSPLPILRALPMVFSHKNETVRAEGITLSHVLYQYIGPGVKRWLAGLKPVQIKDLEVDFEIMEKEGKGKGSIKPERYTRDWARHNGERDIVSRLSSTLQNDLKSSKWKIRKEALESLSALLSSTPRIKYTPELVELAKSLAARIASDANVNCVMVASKCMEDLAKGMMSSFSRFREIVVPPMLKRLKERKTNVADSISAALDAVFSTVTLADIIPDLEPGLKNKNPQVKERTMKFLARCLSSATAPIQAAQIKPLAKNLATLLEDGYEGARNEAAVCLGTLLKMVGEQQLNATMKDLADVRKSKVIEAFEKSTVKCKLGTSARPRIARAPPAARKIPATKMMQPPMKVNPAQTVQNISLIFVFLKLYADAEVQAQLDPQLRSNTSPLSSLLAILREKKPRSPINCIVNIVTIDLARSLLTTKNYVNSALQLTGVSDTELLLDFMLYLLCRGHLSCSEVPDANRRARRLMLKMITKTPVTPSSLFVEGVSVKVDHDYIGRGGFGFVFKGEFRGAAVALKLLYKTRHHDDFCREALMWRSLNHERVLPFLGIFEDEAASRIFLVSPYMKNGTLCQWRKKTGPSTSEIQRLILEVAEGTQYIHSEGIVHGDLRGDNVLLDSHLHAQIADFGLTRHSEATVTRSGALHYNFAAPELLGNWDEEDEVSDSEDDGQLTARTQKSDVYAFGCLYYEIQFDTIPFQGTNEFQIMRLISRGKRPPRLEKPPLSDRAWKLIKRCWAKEAVRRPAMEDIVEKIMAWRSV
ncbi:hypothetical protein AX14_003174 [Amanita brunnescens Koide BX004]|nr:hypothetical protein AX14_003174 [Amanita brunnescens Koide BX004]